MSAVLNTIVLVFISLYSQFIYAETLRVDISNSVCNDEIGKPFCHIKSAINAANDHDVIQIANGNYVETFFIEKPIKLVGESNQQTIIDGGKQSSVITISPGVRSQIKSLTIQNGFADNGGGILNRGSLLLDDVIVKENQARHSGGGIYNDSSISGSLYIKNSVITHNKSIGNDTRNIKYGGGGIFNNSPLIIENSKIQYNQATDNGGALYSIFSGRKKFNDGEIIAEKLGINASEKPRKSLNRKKDIGAVSIKNTTISHNQSDAGGGINVHGVLNISSSIISENNATNGFRSSGGGLFAHFDTTLNMNNVIVSFNKATFRGGGVRFYSVGLGKLSNVSIIDNNVLKNFGQGGGIFIIKGEKSLEIKNTLIARNYIDAKKIEDCYGEFNSLGNNYFSSIETCQGYNSTIDLYEPFTGVDYLYQWDEMKSKYKMLSGSKLNDNGHENGCHDEKNNRLKKDVYGNSRHIDSNDNGIARCDIGAIEFAN